MKLTETQSNTLKEIWKYGYYPSDNELSSWLDWIASKGDDKDIKKINQSLKYFSENDILFKDDLIKLYNNKIKPNSILPNFSFCTIFNFLKTNNLANDNEIPIFNVLNGVDSYWKKSRYHREHQIKFLLLFEPNEILINKLLDFYTEIHKSYTIELAEQKKILKTFNNYATSFIKTLDNETQKNIFKRLDFICSGINDVKDISITQNEEFSFRFTVSVSNSLNNAIKKFVNIRSIFEVIVEQISDNEISDILFKEINNQTKLGVLSFQYVFFSKNKECIDKYQSYFNDFNHIILNDSISDSLNKDSHYVNVYKKICLKEEFTNKFPSLNISTKKHKI